MYKQVIPGHPEGACHWAGYPLTWHQGGCCFPQVCCSAQIVAGVLIKYVNFGKGWRHRLFVLQNGVLRYYKVWSNLASAP